MTFKNDVYDQDPHGHARTGVLEGEGMLTASQVAGMLGISRKRVYELDIPVVQLSSRTLRWLRQDVLEWRDKRRVKR